MRDGELTVADLGEHSLIDRIVRALPAAPPDEIWQGDDAALVSSPGRSLLFTVDVMVEGLDFRLDYASGFDVGWKVVAINSSDVAAMGGRPAHGVATLCLADSTPVILVDEIVSGLGSAARRFGAALVGGDVSGASELSVSVALLGTPGPAVLTRSGAGPGQVLCVTGALGGAAGGLEVLRRGIERDGPEAAALVERQLRPEARVEAGPLLAEAGASAAIDLSDGLAVDLGHLTARSGVGCEVDAGALPLDPHLSWLAARAPDFDPVAAAITGGEDFELLFTIEEDRLPGLRRRLGEGVSVTVIGRTTSGPARIDDRELSEWRKQGWEHLRGR
ncbi:MAG: thiamine-phosphate kinase [Actinomycetota bacterium]